jgi:hypothetical protein
MPEYKEIELRKLFREKKAVFMGDLGPVAFIVHYHEEIIELARAYHVTLMIHRPGPVSC